MLDGQPAVEQYYDSDAGTAMDLYDATTSVVSILVGIALDEGHLTSLEQPLSELLPSYADVMPPEVAVATLRSVLTMTAGFRGNPDANQTVNLPTEDWLPLILSDESRVASGTFTFSSEGAHLLSAIVAEATGRSTLQYAREKLFEPLGIDTEPAAEPLAAGPEWNIRAGGEFTWFRDPKGYHLGYGHLAMTAPDMAKIGQLFLDGGQSNGVQIVPAGWVANATRTQVGLPGGIGYGYGWWTTTTANGHEAFVARGFGGQLIGVVPDLGLVVVMSATVPMGPAADIDPGPLVDEVIAPAVE